MFSRVAIRHKVERARGRKNCAEIVQSRLLSITTTHRGSSRGTGKMDAGVRTEFFVVTGESSSCLPMPLHPLSRLRRASASQLAEDLFHPLAFPLTDLV